MEDETKPDEPRGEFYAVGMACMARALAEYEPLDADLDGLFPEWPCEPDVIVEG